MSSPETWLALAGTLLLVAGSYGLAALILSRCVLPTDEGDEE